MDMSRARDKEKILSPHEEWNSDLLIPRSDALQLSRFLPSLKTYHLSYSRIIFPSQVCDELNFVKRHKLLFGPKINQLFVLVIYVTAIAL